MKIVIASDSYKGSLSSKRVGDTIKEAFLESIPTADINVVPIGDGGEGTVEALIDATSGKIIDLVVESPLRKPAKSSYGISGDGKTAFIEMASASGINLVAATDRNPLISTTYGTGEMILDSLNKGVEKIIIGIGGSATNDGGIGMANTLGVKFLDDSGTPIEPNNKGIENLHQIDMSSLDIRLKDVEIIVACDVNNPLTGKNGASYIYGPQKGANKAMVEIMDKNLEKLALIISRDINKDVDNIPGAGAAGGLGAGLLAFLDGKLESGIDIVLDYLDFDKTIENADLIITGEGCLDHQTVMNKAPIGVARRAKRQNIKVIGISAVFGNEVDVVLDNGIDAIFSIMNQVIDLEEAVKNTSENLYLTAKNISNLIKISTI
ncbi:glycerate kinase [Mycoplasmatota bacterium WC44]